MISVLVIDDHPAMRAGVETVLRSTEDLFPVGAGSGEQELWHLVRRARPQVVLLDYHLPGTDGLVLCHRLKNAVLPPAVVIYSAYADSSLALAAVAAGADGILHKSAPATELFKAIRAVASGGKVLPTLTAVAIDEAEAKVDEQDRPILALLLDATALPDVADAIGIPLDIAAERVRGVIRRLRVEVPTPG